MLAFCGCDQMPEANDCEEESFFFLLAMIPRVSVCGLLVPLLLAYVAMVEERVGGQQLRSWW